ncbi:hypothetical protein MK628_001727 [Escherichia coli]|nr:hypothetical protein [Escherichia coli]
MAVNNVDFFNFARDCCSRNDEIGFRNVISRAYYVAYHKSRANVDMKPLRHNHHSGLIKHIGGLGCENKTMKEISRLLKVMRNARNDADYNLGITVTPKMAYQNLAHYSKLNELWERPETGSLKNQENEHSI